MNFDERENSLKYWESIYKTSKESEIKTDDWLEEFAVIIESCSTPIIELGCGRGNDTLYLIRKGKKVIACDQSKNALHHIKSNFPEIYDTRCFNMLNGLPFEYQSASLIIADLCLHYFREADTFYIMHEIQRVLRPNGSLILRVNSINDVNYGAGQGREIEHHLYLTDDNRLKRFFDEKDIRYFFRDFHIECIREETLLRTRLEKQLYKVCLRNR